MGGLIERTFLPIGDGRVMVTERFDLDHPACPIVVQPHFTPFQPGVRQREITEAEYLAITLGF